MGATLETMNCCRRCTARTVITAVALAASVPAFLPTVMAGPEEEGEATRWSDLDAMPADAAYLDLQRQVNDLRSDLLDERERQIGRQMEANGVVLVVLGVVIGVGGLWFYAKFRAIAAEASFSATNTGRFVLAPSHMLPGTRTLRPPPGDGLQPLPLLDSAALEADPGTKASVNGSFHASFPQPRLQVFPHPLSPEDRGSPAGRAGLGLDAADLQRLEETIADCTEAIRLHPDSPQLYLERAGAHSRLDRYEEAVADYDRAIRLDPDHAAAYLGRCHAKSELGRPRRGHRGLRSCGSPRPRLGLGIRGRLTPANPSLCRLSAPRGGICPDETSMPGQGQRYQEPPPSGTLRLGRRNGPALRSLLCSATRISWLSIAIHPQGIVAEN